MAPLKVQTKDGEQTGVLYDALWSPDFSRMLLSAIGRGSRFTGKTGALIASPSQAYGNLVGEEASLDPSSLESGAEQYVYCL